MIHQEEREIQADPSDKNFGVVDDSKISWADASAE